MRRPMKNRKGISDVGVAVAVIIVALMLILARGYDNHVARKDKLNTCARELQLIKTLPDSVQFYRLSPDCINATPKDTLHG